MTTTILYPEQLRDLVAPADESAHEANNTPQQDERPSNNPEPHEATITCPSPKREP